MHRRLPGFAVDMGFTPAQVWALTTDEWSVLAPVVDAIQRERDEVVARAGRR